MHTCTQLSEGIAYAECKVLGTGCHTSRAAVVLTLVVLSSLICSTPPGFNPAPRVSRTLEEEFASVADKHGFSWSTGKERTQNGPTDSKSSTVPTTVKVSLTGC